MFGNDRLIFLNKTVIFLIKFFLRKKFQFQKIFKTKKPKSFGNLKYRRIQHILEAFILGEIKSILQIKTKNY